MFPRNITSRLIATRQCAFTVSAPTHLSNGRKVSSNPAWATHRSFSVTTPKLTEWEKPPQATRSEEYEKKRAEGNKLHYAYFLQSELSSRGHMNPVEKLDKAIFYEQWDAIPELLKNTSKSEINQLSLPNSETLKRMPKETLELLEEAGSYFKIRLMPKES